MKLWLFLTGFVSILIQVLFLREIHVAFYGVELIYILSMGIWLLWTATGAVIGRASFLPSEKQVAAIFLAVLLLLPVEIILVRAIRIIFSGVPGAYLPFGKQVAAIFLVLMPVCFLLGMAFQWSAKIYAQKGKTLAEAYAVESVGGLFGGLFSTLFLKLGFQNFSIAVICSLCILFCLIFYRSRPYMSYIVTFFILPVIIILVYLYSPFIDLLTTGFNHPDLEYTKDSPYGRLTVSARSGNTAFFVNDALIFESEATYAEELVHIAAIAHNAPKKIFIAGNGVFGIAEEMLKHNPESVDYAELDKAVVDMAVKSLPVSFTDPLKSDKLSLHIGDPRVFLNKSYDDSYDLILSGASEPDSGMSNRFYTEEFFSACARKLKTGGILAIRLQSSENIWTHYLAVRNASIYNALKTVFSDIVVLPGTSNIILASGTQLIRDPVILSDRFHERKIDARLVSTPYIRYLYTNDRFFEINARIKSTNAPVNSDSRPVCYQYSAMIWLSRFFPELVNRPLKITNGSSKIEQGGKIKLDMIIMFVFMPMIFFILVRIKKIKPVILAGLAGWLGMVGQTMIILQYQAKSGVLFQNIGILLMLFMGGLTAGSAITARISENISDGIIGKKFMVWKISFVHFGKILFLLFALSNYAFLSILNFPIEFGLIFYGSLLFANGFLTGGIFSFSSLVSRKADQKKLVSPLYAADLAGGCIGSIAGSLFLIPFAGMKITAAFLIILAIAGFIGL